MQAKELLSKVQAEELHSRVQADDKGMNDLRFYVLFNSISVISGRKRLIIKGCMIAFTVEKNAPRARLELGTDRLAGQHLTHTTITAPARLMNQSPCILERGFFFHKQSMQNCKHILLKQRICLFHFFRIYIIESLCQWKKDG